MISDNIRWIYFFGLKGKLTKKVCKSEIAWKEMYLKVIFDFQSKIMITFKILLEIQLQQNFANISCLVSIFYFNLVEKIKESLEKSTLSP